MASASYYEMVLVSVWVGAYLFAGLNSLYVAFGGIRILDRYFSSNSFYELESLSPFECLYRLHKYSLMYCIGLKRPAVPWEVALWVYAGFTSLVIFWLTMGLGVVNTYFQLGPFSK